jgi:hypothetical protein
MVDAETRAKLREQWRRHAFSEDVSEPRSHRDVQNTNFPDGDLIMEQVEINFSMLHVLVCWDLVTEGCQTPNMEECEGGSMHAKGSRRYQSGGES